jgi:hypothetical protein
MSLYVHQYARENVFCCGLILIREDSMHSPLTFSAVVLSISLFLTPCGRAQPELEFGEKSGLPAAVVMPGAEAEIQPQADNLLITSPNFWSMRIQMDNVDADFTRADPAEHFVIEVACRTGDVAPALELVMINADWSGKAFYRFELMDAQGGETVRIKSTTPISDPVTVEGNFSPLSGIVKNLQILAKAERGNSAWEIDLKSLGSSTSAD